MRQMRYKGRKKKSNMRLKAPGTVLCLYPYDIPALENVIIRVPVTNANLQKEKRVLLDFLVIKPASFLLVRSNDLYQIDVLYYNNG